MTLQEKQSEIIEEFATFDFLDPIEAWEEKYNHLIDLGKKLPKIDDDKKNDETYIFGCQSDVWLDYSIKDGRIYFSADSNGIIPKGIISLLIRVLDGEKPDDIINADLNFIEEIGLQEHLMHTRSNGLVNMVKKMKMAALKAISSNEATQNEEK